MGTLVAGLLCGCLKSFDAAGYTQAILDVSYRNNTEEYMALTGAKQEDADKIFDNNLDATMKAFQNLNLPADVEAKFKGLFEELVKSVKYSVGEAVETEDDNYTINVKVNPITIFDDTYEAFQKKAKEYADKVSNDVMNGADMPSDEEMQNQVYQIYYDILQKEVESGIKYGETKTITVHVNKNKNNIYEIKQSDMTALDAQMISQLSLSSN